LCLEDIRDSDHVVLRDTLRYTHYKTDLCLDRFLDTCSRNRRRDEYGAGIRTGFFYCVGYIGEYGPPQMFCARFLRVGAAYNVRAILDCLLRVESTLKQSEAVSYLDYIPTMLGSSSRGDVIPVGR
jgi:hypothetical protein